MTPDTSNLLERARLQSGPLTLANIDQGALMTLANEQLELAVRDCDRRPSIEKPRTLDIRITLTPLDSELFVERGVEAAVEYVVRPVKLPPDPTPPSKIKIINGKAIVAKDYKDYKEETA